MSELAEWLLPEPTPITVPAVAVVLVPMRLQFLTVLLLAALEPVAV